MSHKSIRSKLARITYEVLRHSLSLVITSAFFASHSFELHAFDISNRWTNTKTDGGGHSRGDPLTLLWSVVPDGEGWSRGANSDLIDYLDVGWNVSSAERVPNLTNRPWWAIMDRVYEQYERVSGLTLTYEPEQHPDGSDTGRSGDLRVGGVPFTWENDKGGVLADNAFPNNGDMRIDTYRGSNGVPSFWHTNSSAFRNLISHESGHGVGLGHTNISGANAVMETPLERNFWGLQFDDIYAFNRSYGDPLEKNGGNDSYSTAHDFSRLDPGNAVVLGTDANDSVVNELDDDWLGIDGTSDEDWFSFFIVEPIDVAVTLSPMGPNYTTTEQGEFNAKQRSNLSFELYDTDGMTPLTSVDVTGLGEIEQMSGFTLSNTGRYYVRVLGEENSNQFYRLDISASVALPSDLNWVGRFSNLWDVLGTDNFTEGAGFVPYNSFDNVNFTDAALEKFVTIPEDLNAGAIVVDADSDYVFAGEGGIKFGSLTKNGSGFLEISNLGNSYAGSTAVNSGTLIVTTTTGNGLTSVAAGATITGSGSVAGNLHNAGAIHPGSSTGSLTVEGDATLESTSVLVIEIGPTSNDLFDVTGALSLDGELQVSLVDSFEPLLGHSFQILNFSSVAGDFMASVLPDLPVGLAWNSAELLKAGVLSVVLSAIEGDYNADGVVNAADYNVWLANLGAFVPSGSGADGNNDGEITIADYNIWKSNLGTRLGVSGAVPEPPSLGLVASFFGILATFPRLKN